MKKINILLSTLLLLAFHVNGQTHSVAGSSEDVKTYPDAKPNSYWKKILTPDV